MVGLAPAVAHDVALDANLLAVDQYCRHSPTVEGIVTAAGFIQQCSRM